ncbi:hypothetical protein DY000_02029006 [Brassica cretica]|uniref:Uncharacterized protein n=1 Tax=Brassica cretica TaxID=69181 RepID=A0ABQ7DVT9_BRACR|nr:hypothetical protein DY000_02029006 [Brassica cretica]
MLLADGILIVIRKVSSGSGSVGENERRRRREKLGICQHCLPLPLPLSSPSQRREARATAVSLFLCLLWWSALPLALLHVLLHLPPCHRRCSAISESLEEKGSREIGSVSLEEKGSGEIGSAGEALAAHRC